MEGSTDLKYARKVADFLGTKHTEVKFTPEEGCSVIPEVIKCLESYDVTTVRASVAMYLVAKYISQNTDDKVIFSGEGSDELFCGYLYFHNAPSVEEASEESKRLIDELHFYDVLRADRTVSENGLELRVPFLDMRVLHFSLGLPAEFKAPIESKDNKRWEKLMLRKAFEDFLPEEVVWRRKNGMSDCGSVKKPWYKHIEEYVDTRLGDELYNEKEYISKEAMYYRLVFNKLFPTYELDIPMWLPRWSGDLKNPSGTLMKIFDDK